MSTKWLELMGVTAQVFSQGSALSEDDLGLIGNAAHWYSEEGNDLLGGDVVGEDGKARADITVFEFEFPASCRYGNGGLWGEFGYTEWEHINYGALLQEEELKVLAAVARVLLAKSNTDSVRSVRFMMAWEVVTQQWYMSEGSDYETYAKLIGWVNLSLEGMAIVPIKEVLESDEQRASVAKPAQDEIPF